MRKNQLLPACGLFIAIAALFFWPGSSSAITGRIRINQHGSVTKHRLETLFFNAPNGMDFEMKISNNVTFDDAVWEKYVTNKQWRLPFGNGTHTVYVKFKSRTGNVTKIFSDSIIMAVPENRFVDFDINNGAESTNSRKVTLTFEYSDGVELFAIGNSSDLRGVDYDFVTPAREWTLTEGAGDKTVFVEFKDGNGVTEMISQTIEYTGRDPELKGGQVVRAQNSPAYYVGYDGKLHPFPNMATFHSWHFDFEAVEIISPTLLKQYQIGSPVCAKPGSWLLKFKGVSRTYAPEPGCHLKPLRSEAEATVLYGENWKERIVTLPFLDSNFYIVRGLSAAKASEGVSDGDHDGVPRNVEGTHGSNDALEDTDGDGLSDYEEIYFWKTNPTSKDTDNDSYGDGEEIRGGFSPVGSDRLSELPDGTYLYPQGAFDIDDGLFRLINEYDLPADTSLGSHSTAVPNVHKDDDFELL